MTPDDGKASARDEELLRLFSSAPLAAERAEALRAMYAERLIGRLKAEPAFRAGIEWLGAQLNGDDLSQRVIALATLERIRSLSKDLEQLADGLTAPGLRAPIAFLDACESGEDRARVASAIGRHRPPWAGRMLARTAVMEPVGGRVSKARLAALEELLVTVGSFESALEELTTALASWAASPERDEVVARRLEFLVRDVRQVLGTSRVSVGTSSGKMLAKLVSVLAPAPRSTMKFDILRDAAEEVALLVHAVVQSRVSSVVEPSTYAALAPIRDWMFSLGPAAWIEFARISPGLALLRTDLAEGIVLRALSGVPDDTLFQRFQAACESSDAAREIARQLASREGIPTRMQQWLRHGRVDLDEQSSPLDQLRAGRDLAAIARLLQDGKRLKAVAVQVRDNVLPEVEIVASRVMLPLRSQQNLLDALLEGVVAFAAERGLRLHGEPGETMPFLPSHHRVAGGSVPGVGHVRIVTPAVEHVGADGTTRVIIQAVVEVAPVPP